SGCGTPASPVTARARVAFRSRPTSKRSPFTATSGARRRNIMGSSTRDEVPAILLGSCPRMHSGRATPADFPMPGSMNRVDDRARPQLWNALRQRLGIVQPVDHVLQAILLAINDDCFLVALDRVNQEHQRQAEGERDQRAIEGDIEVLRRAVQELLE